MAEIAKISPNSLKNSTIKVPLSDTNIGTHDIYFAWNNKAAPFIAAKHFGLVPMAFKSLRTWVALHP